MIYRIHQQDAELRGIAIGEERGEKRGEQKEKINNAKGMLRENFPIDAISRITGLSVSEINKLKTAPSAN
jgi:predicted transposase/invertase (TIGR01784 family)